MRLLYNALLVVLLTIGLYSSAYSQAVPTPIAPRTYSIFHETDNQQVITITWNSNVTISGAAGWTITIGGVPVVPSGSVSAGTTTNIVLPSAILLGQAVTVQWVGGSGADPFGPLASQNNKRILCTDFTFAALNGNTPPCAPVDPNNQMVFKVNPAARNSSFWDLSRVTGRVTWINEFAAPFSVLGATETNLSGTALANGGYVAFDSESVPLAASSQPGDYIYPANDPVCGYTSNWYVRLTYPAAQGETTNCPRTSPNQTIVYASHNNDDTGVGADVIMPATIDDSDLVCLGTNVNMTFTDNTDLNCNPTTAPIPTNNGRRWVRVVYGSTDLGGGNTAANNIPNIHVDGVEVTDASGNLLFPGGYIPPAYPFAGVPDAFGVVEIPATVDLPRGILNLITTTSPVGQAVGQRFWVRLDYWNGCNAYDGIGDALNLRRSVENEIEIIGRPNPPVVTPIGPFCESEIDGNFNFTATGAGAGTLTYTWYKESALTTLLQGPLVDNTFNPITEGPAGDRITKAQSASTTYNRYVTVTESSNNCTSEATEIPIRIDNTNVAGSIAHPGGATPVAICNATDPDAFTSTAVGIGGGPAGTFTYQWQSSTTSAAAGFADIGGANAATFDPPAPLAVTTWFRRRVSSGDCADVFSNVIEMRVNTPVTAGVINGTQTLCTTGNPTVMGNQTTPTGGNGTYAYQWEESTVSNLGPFNTIVGATNSTYDPGGAGVLTQTTHYRRRVTSGVCSADNDANGNPDNIAYTTAITKTVNQLVVPGTIDNAQVICAGDDPATLTSTTAASGGDGVTYTYQWQSSTTSAVAGFGNIGGANGDTFDPGVLTQTTWYKRIVSSGLCAAAESNVIEITVNPLPVASNPTGGGAVCSGNPAPDIEWAISNGTGPYTVTYTITKNPGAVVSGPFVVNNVTSPFIINDPDPIGIGGDTFDYKITNLQDANGCAANPVTLAAVPSRQVSIGGTAPILDAPPTLSINAACNEGASTSNPQLVFGLTIASANAAGFTLNYTIDGSTNRTKTFDTDANGDPTVPIVFTDAELNNLTPIPHVINISTIISPTACQLVVNVNLNFTVNPLPTTPTSNGNVIACSDDIPTEPISVQAPGAGFAIDWYANASGGAALLTGNNSFTSTAAGTYHAEMRNTTTGCVSSSRVPVTLTSDARPSDPTVGADFDTCSDAAVLSGSVPDNGGTGTWTVNTPLYYETFSTADNGLGIVGPNPHATSFTKPGGAWTVTVPATNTFSLATKFIRVNSGAMVAQDVNNTEVVWTSQSIDISTSGNVYVSAHAAEFGTQAAGDYIRLYYIINGGAEVQFAAINDDQDPAIPDNQLQSFISPLVSGNTLQIVARIRNNGGTDGHRLDNVFVAQSGVNVPIISDVNNPTSAVSNLQDGVNTFTWTITSALGACTLPPAVLNITKNPQPITQDINFNLCETNAGTLDNLNYNLTVHNLAVANGDLADRSVTWFTNPTLTAAVADDTDVLVSNNDVFYARVENTVTGCTNVTPVLNAGSVTFTVNPLPVAIDQIYEICEETVGSTDKDNSNLPALFNDLITGIVGSTDRTIAWYIDPGVPVNTPADLVTLVPGGGIDVDGVIDGQRFYALVSNDLTGCQDIASVEFDIRSRPAANPISGSASVCAGTNIILYQISTVVPGSTYSWNLPPDGAGFVRFAGGGPNDFFVLLQFPAVLTPPNDSYNISVTETSPNPDVCIGNANSLTITVESSPSPNPIIGPNPVCKTETEVYQVTSIDPLNTYQWSITSGDAAIVGAASGTGLGSITVAFGTSASSTIRVVEQSPTGCSIAAGQTLVVNANDQPTMNSPATATVCSGLTISTALTFSSTIPLSTFNWQVINVTGTVTGTALGNSGTGDISQTIVNTTGVVASVTYRVTPTSPSGCQGPFQDVVVSITPQPVIVADQTPIVCSGEPVNKEIFLTPLNLPAATIFDWPAPVMSDASIQGTAKNVAAGVSGTFHITDVLNNFSNVPITATYTITPSNGLCNGAPQTVVVTVNPEPMGVNDNTPVICSDGVVNYSLTNNIATLGNNLTTGTTYSWVATPNPNVTGESIVPQGGGTITDALNNVTALDQVVIYTVTPTSSLGCVGNSFTISVTVRPEPVATNDILTICSDNPLAYNLQSRVNLSGNALASNFSWVAASNPNVTGESTALQNTGIITDILNNVTNSDQVIVYTITPTGTNGCVGNPFTLTVTVRPEPVGADDSFTTCSDVALNYNLTNNITTLGNNLTASFSWVAVNNANVTGESTTPQAGNVINNTLTNITNSNQVVVYTVTPTGTNGCPGNDFTVTVTVQPEPRGIAEGPIDVCSNVAFNYSLQNNVNTLGNSVTANFTWSASPNVNVTGESTALQAGATINDILRNVTNADELVTYTITPTGTNGCLGNSFTVTFRVEPEPVGVNDVKTICSDAVVNVDLQDNVTTLGNNLSSNFSWQAAPNANVTGESTTAQASSIITDALSNITNADQVVVYTVTPTGTNGCGGVPFNISVTVRPEPIGINDVKTICSDENVAYDLLSNVTSLGNGLPATFTWVAASNPNVLGESTSAQAGSTITDVVNNVTNTDQVVVYTITPTASGSGCVGSPFTITVTVRPEPRGTNAVKTICSDANVAVDLQLNVNTLPGNSVPATFSWVAASNGNVTGESIVPQAGNTINDVLNNVTNADQVVIYTVTPTGTNGCIGNSFTVEVTVRPEPLGVNASKSICSDENVNVDLQDNITSLGNNLPATFSWIAASNASVSGESTLAQAGAAINDVLTNLTGSDQVVVYTVTPTSLLGCPGNSFTVTVTVQSEPNAPTGTGLICSDATVNFNLQNHVISVGNGQASTFSWIATANGSVSGESTSPVIGNTITDVLTNISNADQVVRYTVTPTGTNGCVGNAFFVDITVRSKPRGIDAPASTCSDVALNIDLQNNITTLGNNQASTFTWVAAANGLVAGESLVPQTTGFITDNLTNTSGVDQTVVYTVTPTGTNGCAGNNFTITVTVQSEPIGDNDVIPICSDNTVNYDLQNNNVNVLGNSQSANFTWIAAANPNVTGENTVLQTTNVINDVLNNVTGVNQTVVYTIVPTGTNGCQGNAFTVSVTVRPEPLGLNDTKIICSDNNVSYNLQDNINNIGNALISNFTWVAAANPNVTGESTVAVPGNVINDNLNNVTSIDQVVIYTVIPTGTNGCVGNSFTVQVTVQPEPQGIVGTKTICSDLSVSYDLQADNINAGGNNVASTFSWIAATNPNVTGESTSAQSSGTISDVLNNVTGTSQAVVYTVTPTGLNGCLGNNFTVTITVNPEPTGLNDTDISCNVPLSYDIQASNINSFGNGVNSLFTYTVLSSDQFNVPAGPDRIGASALPITDTYVNSTGSDVFITYTITPISAANGCAGDTFTYVVTIKSRPIGANYTEVPNICSSVPFVVNPQTLGITNGVASTFTWSAAYATGLTGGAGSGVGNIGETLINVGGGPLSAIYTVTPSAGPCQGPDFTITVVIDPQPVTDPSLATKTICSDLISDILLNTNGISVGATNWDVDVISVDSNLIPNAGNAADPGLAEVADYIQNDRYTNVSFNPGNVIYKVTPIGPPATSCRGVDTFVTLTINPEPVMNPALATPAPVCSDEPIGVSLSTNGASVAAASYIFANVSTFQAGNAAANADETGPGDRIPSVIQNDSYTNLTTTSFTRTYQIKPKSAAGCLGDFLNIPVQVLPEPDFTFTIPPPICSTDLIGLQLDTTPGSVTVDDYEVTLVNWETIPAPGLLPGGSNIAIGSILNATAGSFTINDSYVNGQNVSLNATYSIRPYAPTTLGKRCVGDVKQAVVGIRPSPVVLEDLDEIVCNDATNGILINTKTSSAPANSFEIIRPVLPAGLSLGSYATGTSIVTGNSTTAIANDRFVNNTNNPIPVIYRVRANTDLVPTSGCFGPEEQIQVLVEPQILVTLDATTNLKPDICGGVDMTDIELVSSSNPSSGQVTFNFTVSPAIAGAVPGSNLSETDITTPGIRQALVNTTNAPINVTYSITPRANSAAGGLGCPGILNTTVVSVRPSPKLSPVPANFTICEGVPLGVDFASSTTTGTGTSAINFELVRVEDPNNAPTAPANGVGGFNNVFPTDYAIGTDVLNDVLTNTNADGLQHSIRYAFIPKYTITSRAFECRGEESYVTVLVSPRAEITGFDSDNNNLVDNVPVEVCSGEPFDRGILFEGADAGSTNISWTRVADAGVTGSSGGAGNLLSQVLFNQINNDVSQVAYTVTPRSFNCTGATVNLVASVLPTPKIVGLASSFNICNDADLEINLDNFSPTTNATFSWTVDNTEPLLLGSAGGNGLAIDDTWSNATGALATATYTITPIVEKTDGTDCLGPEKIVSVNVAPEVGVTLFSSTGDNDDYLCEGGKGFLFFENTGLPSFDMTYRVDDGTTANDVNLTKQGIIKLLEVQPSVTTSYTILSVKDAFGCEFIPSSNNVVVVNVGNTDANFDIVGDPVNCSPFPVDFEYNQQSGVVYNWKWFDGEPDSTYTASADVTGQTVRHTFFNPAPGATVRYKVFLEASFADAADPDDNYPGACFNTTFKEVQVYPTVATAIFPDKTEICSGDEVRFVNTSQGVREDKWFYRVQGSNGELDTRTGTYTPPQRPATSQIFDLENITSTNPIIIEVVYQAANLNCPAADVVVPITVYRGVTANFDTSTPTEFIGGHSFVDVTNTSTPIDATDFTYEWNFGVDAAPADLNGTTPPNPIDYTTPGLKEISLLVTNIDALANGLVCSSEIRKTIEIIVPPLLANFRAIPLAACYPVDITVVENLATGDEFEWTVIDEAGRISATSNANLPIFAIPNPGKYSIVLVTTNSFTGQQSPPSIREIEIFESPVASFEVRPTTVFIPDQEITTFNFSTGANQYDWDFGDGNTSIDFEPKITYRVEGEYPITLVAGFNNGSRDVDGDGISDGSIVCYDTLSRTVQARDGGLTRIPNSFTPNPNGPGGNGGNGGAGSFNDVFLPITKGVEEFTMQIFDRWGTLVFESRDKNQGWDGYDRNRNLVPAGVYVYKLELRLSNGDRTTQVGDITLIR